MKRKTETRIKFIQAFNVHLQDLCKLIFRDKRVEAFRCKRAQATLSSHCLVNWLMGTTRAAVTSNTCTGPTIACMHWHSHPCTCTGPTIACMHWHSHPCTCTGPTIACMHWHSHSCTCTGPTIACMHWHSRPCIAHLGKADIACMHSRPCINHTPAQGQPLHRSCCV